MCTGSMFQLILMMQKLQTNVYRPDVSADSNDAEIADNVASPLACVSNLYMNHKVVF